MINYVFTNLAISIVAISCLCLLKNAPARLRFYVSIVAIAAWFMPWAAITPNMALPQFIAPYKSEVVNSFSFFDVSELQYQAETSTSPLSAVSSTATNTSDNFINISTWLSVEIVFVALMLFGVLFFIRNIWHYQTLIAHWKKSSESASHLLKKYGFANQNIELRKTKNCSLAMVTGINKPVIWLNPVHACKDQIQTMLRHEINHVQQNDVRWIWVLTLAQTLFWWNPIVRLFVKHARNDIELSCDEKCQAQDQNYSYMLAQTIKRRNCYLPPKIQACIIQNRQLIG